MPANWRNSELEAIDMTNRPAVSQSFGRRMTGLAAKIGPASRSPAVWVGSVGLLLIAVVWSGWAHRQADPLPFDDAFISYRYVDNLQAGRGLVYNEPDRVMGFTSPIHVLALAGLGKLSGAEVVPLATWVNAAAWGAVGVGIFLLLLRPFGPVYASLGASLVLVSPELINISSGGMESSLFAAWVVLAFLAILRCRAWLAGLLIGLACLTRPEAFVLLPVAALRFGRRWKLQIALLVPAAVCLLGWVIPAWLYYGSPVPLSIVAKAKPLYDLQAGRALTDLSQRLEIWLSGGLAGWLGPVRSWLALTAVMVSAGATFVVLPSRRAGHWVPGLFFLLLAGLYAVGNPLVFAWYMPALLVSAAVTILMGLPAAGAAMGLLLRVHGLGRTSVATWVASLALAPLLLALPVLGPLSRGQSADSLAQQDPERLRIQAYRQVAEYLNQHVQPGQTVAAPEIGALGYYLQTGRILDPCGLVCPEAHAYLPIDPDQRQRGDIGAISRQFVRATEPDWIVTMPVFAMKSLARDPYVAQNYVAVEAVKLPEPLWWSDSVVILSRRR